MATNRGERLASRLRGAGRHQVEDVSFGFILPAPVQTEPEVSAPAQSPSAASAPRSTPNTSAQRRRIGSKGSSAERTSSQPSTVTRKRRSLPPVPAFSSDPAGAAEESAGAAPTEDVYDMMQHTSSPEQPRRSGTSSSKRVSSTSRRSAVQTAAADADDLESLPSSTPTKSRRKAPQVAPSPSSRRSRAVAAAPPSPARGSSGREKLVTVEVGESPVDAPGSGQRRLAPRTSEAAATSSVLLQRLVGPQNMDEEDVAQVAQASSPLTRKSIASAAGGAARTGHRNSIRRSVRAEVTSDATGDIDELSPENTTHFTRLSGGAAADEVDELSPESTRRTTRLSAGSMPDEVDELSPDRPDDAVKSKPARSAKTKTVDEEPVAASSPTAPTRRTARTRATKQAKPAEPVAAEAEEAEEIDEQEVARRLGRKRPRRSIPEPSPELASQVIEEPAAKKRRRKAPESPVAQRQPKASQKERRKPKSKPVKAAKRKNDAVDELDDGEGAAGGTVPVTVQRFTRKIQYDTEDTGADILNSDIPFANRAGVNAVDVLSQLCEALADTFLANLEERARNADDSAAKREFRTMMRALEAFREELRTRLLEQTIALDTLHALRKRVRVAQKQKLALREEILRIRAERDQVALRMDAVRIKHEADSKEALRDIHLSSTMHDIDLAVEKGLAAPALPAAREKDAELGNLELLISRVTDQACTKSDGGGALKQLRDFNAYLERAAAVLEGR